MPLMRVASRVDVDQRCGGGCRSVALRRALHLSSVAARVAPGHRCGAAGVAPTERCGESCSSRSGVSCWRAGRRSGGSHCAGSRRSESSSAVVSTSGSARRREDPAQLRPPSPQSHLRSHWGTGEKEEEKREAVGVREGVEEVMHGGSKCIGASHGASCKYSRVTRSDWHAGRIETKQGDG